MLSASMRVYGDILCKEERHELCGNLTTFIDKTTFALFFPLYMFLKYD